MASQRSYMSTASKENEGIKENCQTFIITSAANPLSIKIPQTIQQPFRYTDKKYVEIQEFFYASESTDFAVQPTLDTTSHCCPINIILNNYTELFDADGSKSKVAEVVFPREKYVVVYPNGTSFAHNDYMLESSRVDPIDIGTGMVNEISLYFKWAWQQNIGGQIQPKTDNTDGYVNFKRPYSIRVKLFDLRI